MNDEMTPEERPQRRARGRRPNIVKAEGTVERGKNTQSSGRSRKPTADPAENLIAVLSQKVVGQPAATRVIVPYIDCGEFQMEHEVAKLIGAPPGYLGHRETQPMLTQQKLNGVTTEKCNLSLVLFDEIEKAAPSMTRLLLGVLDKGILRLGDNTIVNFEKSLVFLTSNLGAREMMRR